MSVKVSMFPYPMFKEPSTKEEMSFLESETLKNVYNGALRNLYRYVACEACPMCCATFFDGIKSKESFDSVQLFVLEFGSDYSQPYCGKPFSFDELNSKCDLLGIPISFAFARCIDLKHYPKYYVAFLNYCPIRNLDWAIQTQCQLLKLFPEANQSCKDPCRLILGSMDHVYYGCDARFEL